MLDFGIFEIRTDIFLLIVSVIFLLLQIFLCLKVKNVVLRLLPTAFFAVLTTVFAVMIFLVDGWDSIGFLFLAICSAFLLFACGIGWGIWAIFKKSQIRKRLNKVQFFGEYCR